MVISGSYECKGVEPMAGPNSSSVSATRTPSLLPIPAASSSVTQSKLYSNTNAASLPPTTTMASMTTTTMASMTSYDPTKSVASSQRQLVTTYTPKSSGLTQGRPTSDSRLSPKHNHTGALKHSKGVTSLPSKSPPVSTGSLHAVQRNASIQSTLDQNNQVNIFMNSSRTRGNLDELNATWTEEEQTKTYGIINILELL